MAILREASSSSSSASGHRYQVFLSFRGKDMRKGFTDHLYRGLLSAGIHTFLDEIELERGRGISHELQKAIEESKIALIVFSKNYAESEWCLEELVRILEMMKTRGLIVIPVFYDVQPSDLKSQRGCFGLSILEKRKLDSEEMMKKMEKWRGALNEVADLAGMVLRNEADGYESKFIQEIIQHVKRNLIPTPSYSPPYLNPEPIRAVVVQHMLTRIFSLLFCSRDLHSLQSKVKFFYTTSVVLGFVIRDTLSFIKKKLRFEVPGLLLALGKGRVPLARN